MVEIIKVWLYHDGEIIPFHERRVCRNRRGKGPHFGVGVVLRTTPTPKYDVSHGSSQRAGKDTFLSVIQGKIRSQMFT